MRVIWDAGIRPPDTRGLDRAERDLFLSLAGPKPVGPKRDVEYRDLTLSASGRYRVFTLFAGNGFVLDSPALPPIAFAKVAGAINVLLRRRPCSEVFLPAELSPLTPM